MDIALFRASVQRSAACHVLLTTLPEANVGAAKHVLLHRRVNNCQFMDMPTNGTVLAGNETGHGDVLGSTTANVLPTFRMNDSNLRGMDDTEPSIRHQH